MSFLSPDEALSNIYPRMKIYIIYGGRGGGGCGGEREREREILTWDRNGYVHCSCINVGCLVLVYTLFYPVLVGIRLLVLPLQNTTDYGLKQQKLLPVLESGSPRKGGQRVSRFGFP